MTPKQLARHWQISDSEAEDISEFINRFYQLDVVALKEGSQILWQGVMYAFDPHNKYVLMESQEKYISRDQAILHWTNQIRHQLVPSGQAKQMRFGHGVPTDVYLALKPVEGYDRVVEQMQPPIAFKTKSVCYQYE